MNFLTSFIASVDKFFERRSHNVVLTICLVTALLIGALDFKGSPGVLILYLVPVAVSAWYGGKKAGWVISIYCALAWLVQSMYSQAGHTSSWEQAVDLGARLATFVFLVNLISRLRTTMAVQTELQNFIIHDLRSPISSSITGLMTLQQSGAEMDPLDKEMVELALVSNQRALNLVNSILDVAKFESGGMEVKAELSDLRELIDSSVEQVALWAQGSELKIETEVSIEKGTLDHDLTGRVIVNLLSNAIKFSPAGSTIRVKAFPDARSVHFVIIDQGPGIPPAYVDSIFEPFHQVKGTKGGTGLGLTFCRLAIQAQRGKIWVESELGKGAQMHFCLPNGS